MIVATIFTKYGYGIEKLGHSLEYLSFFPAIAANATTIHPFWLEDNGLNINNEKLQQNIIEFVNSVKPEFTFVMLITNEINQNTLDKISSKTKLINWFCDDQWRFDSFSSKLLKYLSYAITTDKYSLKKYHALGFKNVFLSQWASFEAEEKINFDNIEYKYDISFVGGKNKSREWLIKKLKKIGIFVHCFGRGWDNDYISYEKMKIVFKTSKINLNLSNSVLTDVSFVFSSPKNFAFYLRGKKRNEQLKARNFEIPAFGGFQLSNYVPELEDYFHIGKDIAIFGDISHLRDQIEFYLSNDEARIRIAQNGYEIAKKNTIKNRVDDFFSFLQGQIK